MAHTADLERGTLRKARGLLDQAFGAEMTGDAWEHALGGMHALAWEDGQLVGHGSVVQRRLLYGGQALRTGYVEGVAVRADRRRRGYGGAVMEALERVVRGGYDLGALGASDAGALLYMARGWKRWRGATWAITPHGRARTEEEDGNIYVLEVSAPLDTAAELICDWRDGDLW